MTSLATGNISKTSSNLSLRLIPPKRKFGEGPGQTESLSSTAAAPVFLTAPLPDKDIERFIKSCVDKQAISRKIIGEQTEKRDNLQRQVDSGSFPTWLVNKFKQLSDASIKLECETATFKAITSCVEKISKAKSTIQQVEEDWLDFTKMLQRDDAMVDIALLADQRYQQLLSFRLAGAALRQLEKEKEKKRARSAVSQPMEDVGGAPTTEEIGTLIQREVDARLEKALSRLRLGSPGRPKSSRTSKRASSSASAQPSTKAKPKPVAKQSKKQNKKNPQSSKNKKNPQPSKNVKRRPPSKPGGGAHARKKQKINERFSASLRLEFTAF